MIQIAWIFEGYHNCLVFAACAGLLQLKNDLAHSFTDSCTVFSSFTTCPVIICIENSCTFFSRGGRGRGRGKERGRDVKIKG